jgi:hypothetical protein
MKVEVGDLVYVGGVWQMKGIVLSMHPIDNMTGVLVSGCFVDKRDIKRIIKRRAIDPKMIKYLEPR